MIDSLGSSRRALLETLRSNRDGATADELAEALAITRTAVVQHLAMLERDGYVARGDQRKTPGRPVQCYVISDKGLELFPKQYSWFAKLMLGVVARDHGGELASVLRSLGSDTAASVGADWDTKPTAERIASAAAAMRTLGYEARTLPDGHTALPIIEADNCVFHELAKERKEVCEFDLALLEGLTGAGVEHQECIARGGNACRFRFKRKRG
jgi:predicted ArsR family transcriptional regulator